MLKKKNLVLIHLESLSNYIYNNNKQYFPNINEFSKHCINFTNFFSTATSTIMTLSDLMYGNIYRLEETKYYGKFKINDNGNKSLFEKLAEEKYIVNGIVYPLKASDEIKNTNIFGKQKILYNNNYGEFINHIDNCIIKDKNFALMVWDLTCHINYSDKRKNLYNNNSWINGYVSLDETFGNVIKILKNKNMLKNTILIAYGDHGDDFYTKKLNGGKSHTTEPYTLLYNTPLLIYSEDFSNKGSYNNTLISIKDLSYIIKNLLTGKILEDSIIESSYIFARNLFSNQKEKLIDKDFIKSYSVSDKKYNMIITSKGLELYFYCIDPINCNNLLDFFDIDSRGNIHIIKEIGIYEPNRFPIIINLFNEIKKEFYFLRSKLKKELLQIYNKVNVEEKNKISMKAFNKIHYIHDYRNYHKYINKSNTLREIIKWINDFDDGNFLLKRKEYPN